MTSTNDGKDVKSNQASGQKGKSYFIELYKSLEAQLNAEASFSDSVTHLCAAWRHVYTLCLHSAPSTHPHLISWIQRHTARTVLQSEWQKEIKDEQPRLEAAIDEFTQECQNAASTRDGAVLPWESQLLDRAAWFKSILSNLWGHPVLKALSNLSGERPSTEKVLEWLREERGIMFAARVRQLALSKRTEDIALTLVTAVMDLVRASRGVVSDLDQVDEEKETPEPKNGEPTFESILSTEAGFSEVWDLLSDIELVLLHKSDRDARLIELAKQMPLSSGYQVVERLLGRPETAPRDKKLWKNVKDVATLVTHLTIARCMVIPVCAGPVRTILYYCGRALSRCCPAPRLPRAAATLAAPAASARHLHTLASALHTQSAESEELKPFIVELYVRAITSGMNELEKLKLKPEYEEKEARATEQTLATWFIQLGNLLSSSARLKYECILTAFSVHPSPAMFDKIKTAPPLPAQAIDTQPKQEPTETPSEFGSWASDSRTQTNFVKTSEHLNMQQTQNQANVLSTTILNEGEALGLNAELCQDIIVLLSGPRVKTLSWDVDRKVLLSNCCTYMERCVYGTRAITTELKYLNLDPRNYQHLPEDLSDEDDVYYGIEKGYEQHLAVEPEPEQIWESEYCDPERTDSATSSYEGNLARRTDKHYSSESDSDPLSIVADKKEKKKERPHSKERSKERKKKHKDTDKSKDKDKGEEHAEKKDETKDKKLEKKEKKERKKREKKEKKAKHPLVGLKVSKVSAEDAAEHNIAITDGDFDSQAKSTSLPEELDEKVVYDGQFSMDEIKSPEKAKEDANKNLNSPLDFARQKAAAALQKAQDQFAKHNAPARPAATKAPHIPNMSRSQQSLKNEVTKNIKKLLQFRRQKMFESKNNPISSPLQGNSPGAGTSAQPPRASNANLSKEQQDILKAMKGEVKAYKSKYSSPKDLKISASCSRVQPFNPAAYSRKAPRPIAHTSNEALNLSQRKPATYNTVNRLDQQNQGLRMPHSQTILRVNDSTHLSSYEKFLRELRRDANAGFDISPFPVSQSKKEIKPISKVTPVIPHTMNTTNTTPTVPNSVETENKTILNTYVVKKPKPRKKAPNIDKLQTPEILNLYNPIKSEPGLTLAAQNTVKTESKVTPTILNMVSTESKATPTMHAMTKQEPLNSQQCAKPIQSKKVENAPNTFARLSYMHKNKLHDKSANDKSKQLMDASNALQSSISEELDRRIAELNATQIKMKALGNQIEFNPYRGSAASQVSKPQETPRVEIQMKAFNNQIDFSPCASAAPQIVKEQVTPRVEVQSIEDPTMYSLKQHPLILSMFKNANLTVKNANVPTEKPRILKQHTNTALTEKDQQELRNLLGQQSLLNRPLQLPKTNTMQSTTINTQFVNNPTNIDASKFPTESATPTMYQPPTPKPMPVHDKLATTNNKGKLEIRFDKPSFDLGLISDTTIKKTTAMIQNKVQPPKPKPRVRKVKIKVNFDHTMPALEVNKDITKMYVPKPPVSAPQYREEVPEQNWAQVLDAIRAHKTPSRGPKALDMLLNKDSFEKVNQRNQRIASSTLVNQVDNTTQTTIGTEVNSTIPIIASVKSSTSTTHVKKQGIKEAEDKPKVRNISSIKKAAPLNKTPLNTDLPKKVQIKDMQKEVDPFISGIPNSDYEILEELMDDDLRQEIGELLSDEDGYKAPVETPLKGLKNIGNQIVIKRKIPGPTTFTIPPVINTPTLNTQPQKSKPQIISNEKVDFRTLSRSLIGSKIVRQEPTVVTKYQNNITYNVNTASPSPHVTSTTTSTMFYNAAPSPSVQNMVIIDPYGLSRNISQSYIPMTNTSNLVYQPLTTPIASQIIIRPTAAATVNVIYSNQMPSTVPLVHIPETTSMPVVSMQTTIAVPNKNLLELPNVEQTDTVIHKSVEMNDLKSFQLDGNDTALPVDEVNSKDPDNAFSKTTEKAFQPVKKDTVTPERDVKCQVPDKVFRNTIVKSFQSIRNDTATPAGEVNSKVPDKAIPKTTAKLPIAIEQSNTEPKLTPKVEVPSKISERKVLSEVQEKFTAANFDSKGPEKNDAKKIKNQVLESEKSEVIIKNQERLATKRNAIINRNINNRSFYPTIPLTYSPLNVFKAAIKTEQKLNVPLSTSVDNNFDVKISKPEDYVGASHNYTSQVTESIINNSKENNESCRRILLRSSNKVEPKVISVENTQRVVGRKTKVRLKDTKITKSKKIEETNDTDKKIDSQPVLPKNVKQANKISTSKISENVKLNDEAVIEEVPKITRISKRILHKTVKKTKEKKVKSKTVSTIEDCKKKQPVTNNKAVQSAHEVEFNIGNKISVPAATQSPLDVEEAILGAMIPKPNETDNKRLATKTKKQKIYKNVHTKAVDVSSKEVIGELPPEICNSNPLEQLKEPYKVINEEKSSSQNTNEFNLKDKEISSIGKTIIVNDTKIEETNSYDSKNMKNLFEIITNPSENTLKNNKIDCIEAEQQLTPVTSAYTDLVNNKISKLVDDIESAISAITESTIGSPLLETPTDNEIIHEEKEEDKKVIDKETVIPQSIDIEKNIAPKQLNFKDKNTVAALPKKSPNDSVKELINKIDNKNETVDRSSNNKKGTKIAAKTSTLNTVKERNSNLAEVKKLKEHKRNGENSTQSHKLNEILSETVETGQSVGDKSVRKSTRNSKTSKANQITQMRNTIEERYKIITPDVRINTESSASVNSIKLQRINSGIEPKDLAVINQKEKEEKLTAVTIEKFATQENIDIVKDTLESSQNSTPVVLLDKRPFLNSIANSSILEKNDEDVILLTSESDADLNTINTASDMKSGGQGHATAAFTETIIPGVKDIPQSFKDSIKIKEIPIPGNTTPNKRCIRITLPNNKVFKATVHGKINVSFDTLFEEPALKNILMSSLNDKKRYTLNIQQLSTTDHRVVETVVSEIDVRKKNDAVKTVDYVNLISDDEDEPLQEITTVSGSFKLKSINQDILKKHQQKLLQKCEIKLRRCDEKPKKDALVEALLKDLNVNTELTTEVIEIEDSSSDEEYLEVQNRIDLDLCKDLLLKDLGVTDDPQNISNNDTANETLLENGRPARTRKSKYHRERDPRTLSAESDKQLSSRSKRSESNKTSRETSSNYEIDEVTDHNNQSEVTTRDCFVKLINCDYLVKNMGNDTEVYEDLITDDEEVIECAIKDNDTPVLSRSGSFSILNEIDLLDKSLTPADGTTSPVMRVFETIHALREMSKCGRSSPVMEAYDIIVSLQDKPPIIETPTSFYEFEGAVLCQSEWFETKCSLRIKNVADEIRTIDDIFYEIVQNKHDNSTDCETDAATDLSTIDNENISIKNQTVLSLKSIMLKYFEDNPVVYKIKPSVQLNDLPKSPLKRKSRDSIESAANKVIKIFNNPLSTQDVKTELKVNYVAFAPKLNKVTIDTNAKKELVPELRLDSTLQQEIVDMSKHELAATAKDKSMEIAVDEDNTSNQDSMESIENKLNQSKEILHGNDTLEYNIDTYKDKALPSPFEIVSRPIISADKEAKSEQPICHSIDEVNITNELTDVSSDLEISIQIYPKSPSILHELTDPPIPLEDCLIVLNEDQCNSSTEKTFQDAVKNNVNMEIESGKLPSPIETTVSETSDTISKEVSFVSKEDNYIPDKEVDARITVLASSNIVDEDVVGKLNEVVVLNTEELSNAIDQDTSDNIEVKDETKNKNSKLISQDSTLPGVNNEDDLLITDTVVKESQTLDISHDSLEISNSANIEAVESCKNADIDIAKDTVVNVAESSCMVATEQNCDKDTSDFSAAISTIMTSRLHPLPEVKSNVSDLSTSSEDITTLSEVKSPKPLQTLVGMNECQDVSVNKIVPEHSYNASDNIYENTDNLPVSNMEYSCPDLTGTTEVKSRSYQNIRGEDVPLAVQENIKLVDSCASLTEAAKEETVFIAQDTAPNIHLNSKEEQKWPNSTSTVIENSKPIYHNAFEHSVSIEKSTHSNENIINSIDQKSNNIPFNVIQNTESDIKNKVKMQLELLTSEETESIVTKQADEVATRDDVSCELKNGRTTVANSIGKEKGGILDSECIYKDCDDKLKFEKIEENPMQGILKLEIEENKNIPENNVSNVEQADIKDIYDQNCKHEVGENYHDVIARLDAPSEVTNKAIDMHDNYIYETEIVVETQNEIDLDNVIKLLPEQDQADIAVTPNLKKDNSGDKVFVDDCSNDDEIVVEKIIKEVDCDDDVFENNATLVYKDDSGVVLKGIQYEDPEIGTCYVFPLAKSSDESGTSEVLSSSLGSTIEVLQEIEVEDDTELSTDLFVETDLKVIQPQVTYSKRNLKRKSDMRDVSCSEKRCRKNSRSRETTEIKITGRKYRKSKNIDMPKLSATAIEESGNTKDFKRRLNYYSSVGFSYAVTFSTEFIDASELLCKWPIDGPIQSEIQNENENQNALFTDLERDENLVHHDPLKLTLVEEIEAENDKEYQNWHSQETNFNMGFGEGSGRVIQNLDGGTISKFSAATLSDVKHNQPCLLSKEYSYTRKNIKNLYSSKQEKLQTMKRYLTCVQLKEKVRSFFRNSTFELISETNMGDVKAKNKNYDASSFPFEMFYSKCIKPFPTETIVQVVQVGQLPVSAAAQNPVTCDPRVTQVSNASPSQCSVVNSPHDDSQPEIKTEYTELTTADLSLPLVEDYVQHNQTLPGDSQNATNMSNTENIPIQTELIKSEVKIEIEESSEEKENSELSEEHNHANNVEYLYEGNNINTSAESEFQALFDSDKQDTAENLNHTRSMNGSSEKTDQIAHAMNAAGITTSETANTRAQALVNILTQKLRPGSIITTPNSMSLQQALASILPPPLNQTSSPDTNQQGQNTVTPQVLHIVQGKNASGNQITLVDNSQQSVITNPNATPVLHIVQNKAAASGQNANGSPSAQPNTFSSLSLVDAGLQQSGNQLLHIVNTGNQKNNNAGQLLKRVNLLTNLANVQGSNEQKMVQFVCKSADGKSIQLNAPHQRSMVLRLQPIETPNVQPSTPKPAETNQDLSPSQTSSSATNKDSGPSQQEIKSRSVYEENYAKFIQNSSNKPTLLEKSNSLPKFNQAFGKAVFQDGNQKQNEMNSNNLPSVNTNSDSPECSATDNTINIDHIGQISSPPLLLRKSPAQTTQSQQNLVQQIKQTIAPMNIQTMHGGVIYTRQIPVNIGGGQTINLITVPSTELIDESGQKQQVNQGETIEPSIIKIVPQSQPPSNAEVSDDMNNDNAQQSTPQPQPVLTQMRIKLPMLSKAPQMVSGARVVRPSFFQIQRNVIGGGNQAVYQQLVLTAAPPLGQQTIRLPQAQTRQIKIPENQSSSESQMSSSTLEQLREFDMVLEQVKERSTVQPNSNPSNTFKLHTSSTDTTDSPVTATSTSAETTQVLYSIGSSQPLNVTYVNRKPSVSTPTTSTFVRSPDSSGIADSPTSSSHSHIPHTSTSEASSSETTHHKPVKVSSKSKSRPKSSSHTSNSMKLSSVPPKTSTQKPLEDEQTTQRILYILAEYKEQVENSPDKDKPAPRRRTNPPSNPGSSKRKKSSSGSRRSGRDISPIDDSCRTMGSEDSSCGTSQGDCTESCMDSHSPQDSPRKVARKLAFEQDPPTPTQSRSQPQRNVIVADGQTITVARGTAGKPATAVLMPANYILPVSMVKGGQQIAIVTNRGPKLLTVGGGEGGATNALLLQRLIGPAGLKPVLTRPGVRHVRLPTAALHNLQAFNLATATSIQPPDSTASPAPDPPSDFTDSNRTDHSPWTDRDSDVKPDRASSPDDSEPWNMPSSADPNDYCYEETVRAEHMDRTVLDPIQDRYSPEMEAQRIFDKMFDVDAKKSYIVDSHVDSPRCAYDIDASDCDDKSYQVVHKRDGSHRQTRLSHVSAAALRHKYAILEHELRLQKSLSEECEDLGVDSPSASELFPEAELLFAASPAQEHGPDTSQHSHTPQPTILNQTVIQPDIDDQIATDQLIPRHNVPDDRQDLDVSGLEDVGIVTVSEDGMQATIALDHEEFARAHPNTTFHSEPTDEGEVQPFTISGLKTRHITSTIFHANRVPATVLMTAPQATVISQAAPEPQRIPVKYSDINNMIHAIPSTHTNNINLSSVLVKDDGLTRFDNILTDSRELHLSNTASAIVHSAGNATQVIRRVCYDDSKRERESFLMDEPDALIAGDDAKMIAEDSSRDATMESMGGDDDNSSPERHAELFWESNSASERSESRRPLDFSSDSEKCCKSPSYDETNSTDSSGVGTHMRLDSVIKEARGIDRSASAEGSSADDTHPPLRTYPPKRLYHNPEGELERSLSGKTRAGERSPDLEVRRRASGRGVVKRGCHCCNGSPAPPRPKKPRQRKPTMDFTN